MKLLFKNNIIGEIYNIISEQFEYYGDFKPSESFNKYREFFCAVTCENGFEESKFKEELLKDENWNIDNDGDIIGICIPAIYENSEIYFRYR